MSRQSFLLQQRHDLAQPRPREPWIAVRGIVRERDARLFQRCDQPRFRNVEQRPHDDDARAFGLARHGREAGQPAATRQTKEDRFGLIVERVCGQNMTRADARGFLAEEFIACAARRILQAGLRLCAAPAQCPVRHVKLAAKPRHRPRLARRFLAQAVIDRHRDKFRSGFQPAAPARGETKQRGRIRPAGDREDE